jgi:hypothetical protein
MTFLIWSQVDQRRIILLRIASGRHAPPARRSEAWCRIEVPRIVPDLFCRPADTREQGTFKLDNPWHKIGWGTAVGMIVIAVVIGFGFLSRYQQNGPTLDLWSGICRGLGITRKSRRATRPHGHLL